MTLALLRFVVLIAGWWAVLWYVLPVDLQQQSAPELVSWHLAPPLLTIVAWSLFKNFQTWRTNRRAEAEATAREAERLAALDAAKAASQQELARRRAHVECRAAWAIVSELPQWYEPVKDQHEFQKDDADSVRGAGREAALAKAVRQIFASALTEKNAALTWLPVYVMPEREEGDSPTQLDLLQDAWRETVGSLKAAHISLRPDCKFLPGTESIIERVFRLFDADPTLPALFLLGMDSPLADAANDDDSKFPAAARSPDRPGHAVVALLLSRPGLALPEGFDAAVAALENKDAGPYTPYWEREQEKIVVQGIGRIPLPLQPGLLALKPFATFCRFRSLESPRVQKITAQLEALLVDAGLSDPSASDDAGKSENESESEQTELGWLVHNSGGIDGDSDGAAAAADRIAAINLAIARVCGKLDSQEEASNFGIEHGEVGTARSVLMLAEGLVRAEQLKKPVLIAEYGDSDRLEIGLSRPV
jgi:hypothetical protein